MSDKQQISPNHHLSAAGALDMADLLNAVILRHAAPIVIGLL
jgi:hypothetical protein